jgi:tetratricopeptide (TPR) repeat protein
VIPAAYLEPSAPAGQPPAPDPPDRTARRPRPSTGSGGADRSNRAAYAEANDSADKGGPNAPARLFEQGAKALSQGSAETAMVCFRQAMGARPDDPQIPISAAVLALQHNRPDMAIEVVERSLKALPKSAALHRILGAAYYRQGDYPASQSALQQALSLDKSSALSYFLMGCTLAKLGQAEAAETHFRQAQAIDSRYTVRRGGGVASSTPSLAR